MSRNVHIASVQLPAFPAGNTDAEKKESNYLAAEAMLAQAGEAGADIAVMGEIFNVHGCSLTAENFQAQTAGDLEQTHARVGALAKKYSMYVIAPLYAVMDGIPRNVALLYDRSGECIGHYFKVHCIEDERSLGVVPGSEWPVFKLDFGSIGIQICHDASFPESARCLAINGAEIIFWPHVMSGWGDVYMDILLRSPAIHNGVHFVPACYGCDVNTAWKTGLMLLGRSCVVAPDGIVIVDAGRSIGIAQTTIDLDAPRVVHMWTRQGEYVYRVDMLIDRRPETYACLLRPTPPLEPVAGADLANYPERAAQIEQFITEHPAQDAA